MPPKRTIKTATKTTNSHDSDSESEQAIEITPVIKTAMYINSKSTDNDRLQLAQAINNFTIKSEQFLQEMKNFDSFRENVFKLDLLIDSKKKEYSQTNENLELEYTTRKKNLEMQYAELNKKLKMEYDDLSRKQSMENAEKIKKCEVDFADKNKALANTLEDETIQMKRKLESDKTKACVEYAKSLGQRFIKEEEYKVLTDNTQKALNDYTELKKTFDKQCNQIKEEEKVKYQNQLKSDTLTMDLTHKASNATLMAQTEQQKKEILVLNDCINNLKSELREQRELTKQVAQASAKSQITQTIGNK
mgnify:CR=1 FL=1